MEDFYFYFFSFFRINENRAGAGTDSAQYLSLLTITRPPPLGGHIFTMGGQFGRRPLKTWNVFLDLHFRLHTNGEATKDACLPTAAVLLAHVGEPPDVAKAH